MYSTRSERMVDEMRPADFIGDASLVWRYTWRIVWQDVTIGILQSQIDAAKKCLPLCVAVSDIYDSQPFKEMYEILNLGL